MDDRRAFQLGSESVQAFLRHFGLSEELSHWLLEMAIVGQHAHWNLAMQNCRLIPLGKATTIRPWSNRPDIAISAATAHECAGILYHTVFLDVCAGAPDPLVADTTEASVRDWIRTNEVEIARRVEKLVEAADYSAMLALAADVERERILALREWPNAKEVDEQKTEFADDHTEPLKAETATPGNKCYTEICKTSSSKPTKKKRLPSREYTEFCKWYGKKLLALPTLKKTPALQRFCDEDRTRNFDSLRQQMQANPQLLPCNTPVTSK